MIRRLAAILFIYMMASLAWVVLGSTVLMRTSSQDTTLKRAVDQIWGTVQTQQAPVISYVTHEERRTERIVDHKTTTEIRTEPVTHYLPLDGSDVDVKLNLEHRQKGLLWYSTYKVGFGGTYKLLNDTGEDRDFTFAFTFPAKGAVYDDFMLRVGREEVRKIELSGDVVSRSLHLRRGQSGTVAVRYRTQGLDEWWYDFGSQVSQVKQFRLAMHTDFDRIDFPQNSISATDKTKTPEGWLLHWDFKNLLTSVKIGMEMPKKLNPGPWVSEVTFSAPISLFLFLFFLFVVTALRKIPLHPMHYFFISASFFAFHLLLAYLVDHLSVQTSVAVCSIVSIALLVSYMRLVVSARFAFVEVALAQVVYLVLFSYTFFLEGYTGLAITVLCIATLFATMQMTGRVDWDAVFQPKGVN